MRGRNHQHSAGAPRLRLAKLLALALLTAGVAPVQASQAEPKAQRLAALVQGFVERQELPPMATGARYFLTMGTQQLQFDEAALERANAMTKATVQAFAVQDFRVRSVDCGRDLCWIRYDYRFVARTVTSETKGVAECEEVWVSDGERLLFLIGTGRQ
jgi:hypothetical protein